MGITLTLVVSPDVFQVGEFVASRNATAGITYFSYFHELIDHIDTLRYDTCVLTSNSDVRMCRADADVSLHQFPKEEKLRKEWAVALRIGKKVPTSAAACSLHFQDSDFTRKDGRLVQ